MVKPSTTRATLTRRDAVKGAVGLAALGGRSVLAGVDVAAASGRDRVAIIGAGAGGVAAAYFLAGTHSVDVFEARTKIGGHCDSHVLDYRGERVVVDLGAQFFHPETHPIYVTLLEQLGLFDPARLNGRATLAAPGSLCIFPMTGGPPVFSSAHPLATLPLSLQFANYTQLARSAVLSNLPWETTVDAWIRSLSVSQPFKDEIAFPWTASLIGSPQADALRASARSILQTFALTFPANVAKGATTFNSRIGLQGNLQRLLDHTPTARVHLNAPVLALMRRRDGWSVRTRSHEHGPYRHIVLNLPPRDGRRLLRKLPTLAHVTSLLDRYEYFDSRLLIHTDPAYMQPNPTNWAAYNAGVTGRECEGSVWLGALGHTLPSGSPVNVFKSWAEHRRHDPRHILFERRFKHPVISRAAVEAARALRPLQGRDGLYFCGQYTTGFDSQEAAVYSAMKLTEALAPRSRTLAALKRLLAARGHAGISYEL